MSSWFPAGTPRRRLSLRYAVQRYAGTIFDVPPALQALDTELFGRLTDAELVELRAQVDQPERERADVRHQVGGELSDRHLDSRFTEFSRERIRIGEHLELHDPLRALAEGLCWLLAGALVWQALKPKRSRPTGQALRRHLGLPDERPPVPQHILDLAAADPGLRLW